MFWRTFIFAFLAVGALAEKFEILEANRNLVKYVLTTVCKKAGAVDVEDSVKQVTNSVESFLNCVNLVVNFQSLNSEIEEAKPKGVLGEVFKKYCAKTPELKTCFHTLIDAASPCMESAENELPLAKNGTDHIIDYVCYNDGNRITQFLTENGTDCIMAKGKEISEINTCFRPHVDEPLENLLSLTVTCMEKFLLKVKGNKTSSASWTLASRLPYKLYLLEKCRIYDRITSCILRSLKTCTPPTPGYLLESLVGYMRKESECNDALPLPATTETTNWPTATRISSPTGMRTTSPPATRTTSPMATRTTSPTATRTTSPTTTGTTSPRATKTTSPTATKTISPMFELTVSLTGTVRVAFP